MTDLVTIALIGAAPPTLAVILSHISQRRKLDSQDVAAKEVAASSSIQGATIEKKVEAVHAIADGRLTAALDKIDTLAQLVSKQQTQIDSHQSDKRNPQ